MRIDLTKLLTDRTVRHPSVLKKVHWSSDGLKLTLEGYPWWRQNGPYCEETNKIDFVFRNIGEGWIIPDTFNFFDDEFLEDFEVIPLEQAGWAQPCEWSIYCSGPIPDPLRLYMRVNDHLAGADSFRTVGDFLNCAQTVSGFMEIAESSSYLLARCPESIRLLLTDELKKQNAPFTEERPVHKISQGFLVRVGNSAFLCGHAWADISEAAQSG